ncbi:MAG: hypothetical protein KDN18_03965 [Verrucomicrobiae bacterium]|nr:hypothetical protein [Verrucomicrobiae bacterium]
MKTQQFTTLILGVFGLIAPPSYGETPISADGYMGVKWGATLQEAISALPDFRRAEYTANKNMFHGDIPCDTTLSNGTDTGIISLLFYDGKFIAIHRVLKLLSLPDGIFLPDGALSDDFRSSLSDLLRTALTPVAQADSKKVDELNIRIGGMSPVNSNSNPIEIPIFIENNVLVANAMSKRDEVFNQNRKQFLDTLAEKILTP